MSSLLPNNDPDKLLEYSVVYTDRALNHMSQSFQGVMKDISVTLKKVYHASAVIVVPGSGTYGMEAVARQFATDKKCLIIRNGWFSYRWTQIFEMGDIPSQSTVLKARRIGDDKHAPLCTRTHRRSRANNRIGKNRTLSSRHTSKPHPGSFSPTTTSVP